jgi:hypothetical protein
MTNQEYIQDIANRLRGVITIPVNDGHGLLDGKDTFTRDFGHQGELQHRASLLIESLLKGEPFNPQAVMGVRDELMEPDDPHGMGKKYLVPIRIKGAQVLELFLQANQNTDTE